jgi:hypothetical protein
MKNMGIVRGSKELAQTPFQVCVDTVFLRFNPEIVPPQESGEGEDLETAIEQWQYHEIQYSLREWIQFITESMIDINTFALVPDLVKELENQAFEAEIGGEVNVEMTYAGLPEQKPFTFTPRFTTRRTTT